MVIAAVGNIADADQGTNLLRTRLAMFWNYWNNFDVVNLPRMQGTVTSKIPKIIASLTAYNHTTLNNIYTFAANPFGLP
jgi:hypothetical protein